MITMNTTELGEAVIKGYRMTEKHFLDCNTIAIGNCGCNCGLLLEQSIAKGETEKRVLIEYRTLKGVTWKLTSEEIVMVKLSKEITLLNHYSVETILEQHERTENEISCFFRIMARSEASTIDDPLWPVASVNACLGYEVDVREGIKEGIEALEVSLQDLDESEYTDAVGARYELLEFRLEALEQAIKGDYK